jgi:CheY-like chemotaxis protein
MNASRPKPHVILVVDDEFLIRTLAVDALRDAGFRTFEAQDAADALRQIHDHPEIDLLFTDLNMPGGIDGLQLAQIVFETRPEVSLILTSGQERPSNHHIPDQGRFLPKPYTAKAILHLIRSGWA